MLDLTFSPSPDVTVVLNVLLDIYERRINQNARNPTEHAVRSIKVNFSDITLPTYFSQTDPNSRFVANEQFQALERAGLVKLAWITGETGHLLESVILKTEHATRAYQLLNRSAKTTQQKVL